MLNDLANRVLTAGINVMGDPVTLTRGGQTFDIKGIFQETYKAIDPETGFPVTTLQPVVSINRTDITTEPKVGDVVVVRGTNYRVRDLQSDGHTGIHLMLQRTSARV